MKKMKDLENNRKKYIEHFTQIVFLIVRQVRQEENNTKLNHEEIKFKINKIVWLSVYSLKMFVP